MDGLIFKLDEQFINNYFLNLLKESKLEYFVKNLFIKINFNSFHIVFDFFLNKNFTKIDFELFLIEVPKRLFKDNFKLSYKGDKDLKKILEGITKIFLRVVPSINFEDDIMILSLEKAEFLEDKIKKIFEDFVIKQFLMDNGQIVVRSNFIN